MEVFAFVLEKLLSSEETQINGVCIVEDFSGYTMGQVAAVGVNEYKQMVDMLQVSRDRYQSQKSVIMRWKSTQVNEKQKRICRIMDFAAV